MTPFALTTDARVKSATKDLLINLQNLGIERTLKEAREIVSKMFGYDGWEDLLSKLAPEPDLEDCQCPQEVRASRAQLQERVLLEHGVPADQVGILRQTLSITGRSANDSLPRTIVEVSGTRYHPVRVAEALEWLIFREKQFLESGHVYRDYPEHFNSEFDDGYHVLDHTIKLGRLMPLDNTALERHEMALDLADAAHSARNIIDVAPLGENVPHQIGEVPDGVAYLCFGQNAWPSPYASAGIEGCYVEKYEEGNKGNVMLVVSPDFAPGGLTFPLGRKEAVSLIKELRVAHFEYSLDERRIPTFTPQDGYAQNFDSFVNGPATLALKIWSNMAAYQDFVGYAVQPDTPAELLSRLSRTRSPEILEETLEEMAEYEQDYGVVRLLGGIPDEAIPPAPVVEIKDPAETALHFHDLTHQADEDEDVEYFTGMSDAAAMAAMAAGVGDARQLEGVVALNAISRANVRFLRKRPADIILEAKPFIEHHHPEARTCAQVLVMAEAVLARNDELVREVMQSAQKCGRAYPGVSSWVLALGEAHLNAENDRPLLQAARIENPLVEPLLNGKVDVGYANFPNIWPEPMPQAELVAGYLRKAWKATRKGKMASS